MFKHFKTIAKNLSGLKSDRYFYFFIRQDRIISQIIDLNTEVQLYEKGIDSKGNSLGDYSFVTKYYFKPLAATEGRDGRTDHITLKDTGEFYRSFKVKVYKDSFVISANTQKEDNDLAQIFGREILGLTNESLSELIPEIKERINEILRIIFSRREVLWNRL
jgi:hypothetical protein